MKRFTDILMAAIGLLLLSPVFLMLAFVILIGDGPPILYRQERVGRGGKPFKILKFRTMVADAEHGRQLTASNDSRITRTGRFLRKLKLDELPQLINVLFGEMSFVGPRPEVARYVAHYPPAYRELILAMRPGITDPASIKFRDEGEILAHASDPESAYIHRILPMKVSLYRDYIANATWTGDMTIILKTIFALFSRRAH